MGGKDDIVGVSMVVKIYDENEIALNGKTYTIKGKVLRTDISQFPSKLVMGDTTYDDEPVLSNWIISDQRGGIGKEYASPKDLTKCWWSTCNLDHEGHLIPQPLATASTLPTLQNNIISNGNFETGDPPTGWEVYGTNVSWSRSNAAQYVGAYSGKLVNGAGAIAYVIEYLAGYSTAFRGKTATMGCWVYATTANRVRIAIQGNNSYYSSYHTGSGWEWLTASGVIDAAEAALQVWLVISAGTSVTAYFDWAVMVEGSTCSSSALQTTDGGLEAWTGNVLDNWTFFTEESGTLTKETTIIYGGAASAKLHTVNTSSSGHYTGIYQDLTGWSNNLRGTTIRVGFWTRVDANTDARKVSISDGIDTTETTPAASGAWTQTFVTHKINAAGTKIRLTAKVADQVAVTKNMYVDDIAWGYTSDVNFCYANFNNGTYFSKGSILYKVDYSTGAVFFQAMLPKTITSLTTTVGTTLAIGQGDTYVWYYLTADGGTLVNNTGTATGSRDFHCDSAYRWDRDSDKWNDYGIR
jgi:hypothetical protein